MGPAPYTLGDLTNNDYCTRSQLRQHFDSFVHERLNVSQPVAHRIYRQSWRVHRNTAGRRTSPASAHPRFLSEMWPVRRVKRKIR